MTESKADEGAARGYPGVTAYPVCSECETPYVLRRAWLIQEKGRTEWIWQRDCKHKKAEPKLVTEAA